MNLNMLILKKKKNESSFLIKITYVSYHKLMWSNHNSYSFACKILDIFAIL